MPSNSSEKYISFPVIAAACVSAAVFVVTKFALSRSSAITRPAGGPASPTTPDPETLHSGTVSELWVFPIKGVRGSKVQAALLTSTGLQYDREWAIVAADADKSDGGACGPREVFSVNKAPGLGRARATIDPANMMLVVHADGGTQSPLYVPLRRDTRVAQQDANQEEEEEEVLLDVALFGMEGTAVDEGDRAAQWFTLLVGRPVRLARIKDTNSNDAPAGGARVCRNRRPEQSPRHAGTNIPSDTIKFHDYGTLHVICESGVEWLAANVRDASPVTTEQFRANIVVAGVPFPEEDVWKRLRIGEVAMRVAKQSGRCVIPTTNASGTRNRNFEPTATLRRLRSCYHRHQQHWPQKSLCYMFGLDLFHDSVDGAAVLRVGDAVVPTETQPAPLFFIH
jgi:uncharacterized protein YcbX